MNFFEVFFSMIGEALLFLPIFAIIAILILKRFYKIDVLAIGKNQMKKNKAVVVDTQPGQTKQFKKIDELPQDDIESVNIKQEIKEIQKQLEDEGLIRVDFAKAMYIMRHCKNYNMFSSEDGRVVFEKLKETIDSQTVGEVDVQTSENETQLISAAPNFEKKVENLGGGKFKISTASGYVITENGVVIEAVDMNKIEAQTNDNKNKKSSQNEELKEKLTEYEDAFIENHKNAKKQKREAAKKIEEKKDEEEKRKLDEAIEKATVKKEPKDYTAEIENVFANLGLNEKSDTSTDEIIKVEPIAEEKNTESENEEVTQDMENEQNNTVPKEVNKISRKILTIGEKSSAIEEIESITNYMFIFEDFENRFYERMELLILENLFNPENLIHQEEEIVFVDLDLKEKILYIDVYLFLHLFAKLFKNNDDVLKMFLNSTESVDLKKMKKLFENINKLNLFDCEKLFICKGRLNDYIMQRSYKYTFEETEKKVSSQMLMINTEIECDNFQDKINIIKENIIIKYRASTYKIKLAEGINNLKGVTNNSFM